MQKDASYHEAAVRYNQGLAERAEELVKEMTAQFGDVVPVRWARSVGKQHRFHEGRHQKAFDKINSGASKTEETEDGGEDRIIEEDHEVHRSAVDGQFVTAEEAEENPDTTVTETVEEVHIDHSPEGQVVPSEPQPVEDAADPSQAPAGVVPGDDVYPQDSSPEVN